MLTTHYIEEAEWLCDEPAIVHRGTVVARGHPDRLIEATVGGRSVSCQRHNYRQR